MYVTKPSNVSFTSIRITLDFCQLIAVCLIFTCTYTRMLNCAPVNPQNSHVSTTCRLTLQLRNTVLCMHEALNVDLSVHLHACTPLLKLYSILRISRIRRALIRGISSLLCCKIQFKSRLCSSVIRCLCSNCNPCALKTSNQSTCFIFRL